MAAPTGLPSLGPEDAIFLNEFLNDPSTRALVRREDDVGFGLSAHRDRQPLRGRPASFCLSRLEHPACIPTSIWPGFTFEILLSDLLYLMPIPKFLLKESLVAKPSF